MPDNTFTTYNTGPYFDDYHAADLNGLSPEQKNYLRILYKPGVSVQARELNQMQSMIQAQIDKFGRGVFSEGAGIIGGEKHFDNDVAYIDITANFAPEFDITAENIQINNGTTNTDLKATILHYEEIDSGYRFFIRYDNSKQDNGNVYEFSNGDVLTATNTGGSSWTVTVGTVTAVGYASLVKVESGVFFVRGEFVLADEETLYLVKPSSDYLINGKLSFEVTESVIGAAGSEGDSTLYDNASGEPNFAAPGADRYAIALDLKFISEANYSVQANQDFVDNNVDVIDGTDTDPGSDIQTKQYSILLNIGEGVVQNTTQDLLSNSLDATLAKRTYEESGNYAVSPFILDVREYLNDTTDIENRGLYTTTQIDSLGITVQADDVSGIPAGPLAAGDIETYAKSRFAVGLEPSIAYVDGYRIEAESKINIPVEKARGSKHTETGIETYSTTTLGNYLIIDSFAGGLPTFGETITFTDNSTTAKIRGLEKDGSVYYLYLYDVSGPIPAVDTTTTTSGFDPSYTDNVLHGTDATAAVFPLSYSNIEDVSSVELTIRESITDAATNGVITNTITGARFFDLNEDSYIVIDSTNTIREVSNISIGGTNNDTVTITLFDSITDTVTVLLSYQDVVSAGTKGTTSGSITLDLSNGEWHSLGVVDVYEITGVVDNNSPAADIGVLSDYVLDTGQRDGIYKNARVKYIGANPGNVTSVDVSFNRFTRTGSNTTFYSVNSYSGVAYEDIPSYNGIPLSDALDFRPDEGSYNVSTITPNNIVKATVNYYLNRIDSVVVNSTGSFEVIQGIPALEPAQPETPDNSMLLYTINVPAYTFSVKDIQSNYIDNRRYTMRDIGNIEERVKNLEYYTSLSLLEKEANEKQIFEADLSRERFKNGILVDSFFGHSVGNVNDKGYICSTDQMNGILRPSFTEKSTRFKLQGIQPEDPDLALLPYEEEPLVEQLKASTDMSVNPYAVASWLGEVKLSPSSDEWKETTQRPDIIIDDTNNAATLQAITDAERAQGTIWGSWRTNWTGSTRIRRTRGNWKRLRDWGNKILTGTQTREGVRTSVQIDTVQSVLNNKVLSTSFVPFIRSRKIYFKCEAFKPNTKLYVFFDNVDITAYSKEATFVAYKDSSEVTSYLNETDTTLGNAIVDGNLTTDASGRLEGYFIIPNNAAHKFRTGERKVNFTDSPDNDVDVPSTTSAEATYVAAGIMEHKQRTVVTTRKVSLSRERISQSRGVTARVRRRRRWRDPLAQSFMISDIDSGVFATSIDLFFSKKSSSLPVTVHIVTMDNGYPTQEVLPFSEVTLYPNDVNLINENDPDASAATNFKFPSPVFLDQGIEYAIVVISNDDRYRIWLSEMGKFDVATNQLIEKNPYAGVMFKSQNASTWSADQNMDFKFRLNRAKFDIATGRTLTFDAIGEASSTLSFSQLSVISESLSFPNTSLSYNISIDNGATYHPITLSDDILLNGDVTIGDVAANSDIKLQATLSSNSDYISPAVDLDRVSLNSVYNFINSNDDLLDNTIDTELSADHGTAEVRYITHEVVLNNPADELNVYLNINKPINTADVKVYARFKTTEELIDNEDFIEIEPTTLIPTNSSVGDYSEVLFKHPTTGTITEFSSFQIKVVLLSTEHWNVPTIKDFRAIATT